MGIENPVEYLRTLAHWWAVYVTVYAFCWALSKCRSLDRLFDQLILLNFCAAVLGVILRPTPLQALFWMNTQPIIGGPDVLRLNLLSTEPSAYAELTVSFDYLCDPPAIARNQETKWNIFHDDCFSFSALSVLWRD